MEFVLPDLDNISSDRRRECIDIFTDLAAYCELLNKIDEEDFSQIEKECFEGAAESVYLRLPESVKWR